MNETTRWHELIALYQIDRISGEEFAELEGLLRDSLEARQIFHRACRLDSQLQRHTEKWEETATEDEQILRPAFSPFRSGWLAAGLAAAVVVLLGALGWMQYSRPKGIATIASVEDASWRSSLPTELGVELTKGYLNLTSGISTIRFHSGAEVTLEAPATLTLISPMRARLDAGTAIIEVPDSAIGFVLETPDGYAVDYGTRFAVAVDGSKNQSSFEVIEGEIAVHQPSSGEEVRLSGEGQSATVSEQALFTFEAPEQEETVGPSPNVIRIGTDGRATSVLPNNKREKFLPTDLLAVKRTNSGKWAHRSFFSFELSGVDLDSVGSAHLRLNLVPSARGYASRLPKINRFAIYGITNPKKETWEIDSLWEEAPAPEDGDLLGTLEIPRSIERGSFEIRNAELLDFLRADADGVVTLLLVRETAQVSGKGAGMTHMFASDSHPESVGPTLEFSITE